MQKATETYSVRPIINAILAQTVPNNSGVTHPGNWPADATLGVSYRVHDRQFSQVEHSEMYAYFKDVAEFEAWLNEQREWLKGTDYDFSLNYSLYEWDLGPNFKHSQQM